MFSSFFVTLYSHLHRDLLVGVVVTDLKVAEFEAVDVFDQRVDVQPRKRARGILQLFL